MIRKPEEIALMREAGRRLARVLKEVARAVRAGIATRELDKLAGELIRQGGDAPAFLGYRPSGAKRPYPAVSCISINDVVVHGVPDGYVIQDGDVVKMDLGLVHRGWYADMAVTVGVGKIPKEVVNLITVTREALERGIRAIKPGSRLGDIGAAVEKHVETRGFSVVKSLTGHGIGRALHEDPWVYNMGHPGTGEKLVPGMTIAIEPMVAMGRGEVRQLPDDSFATRDGSRTAHFEHTVAITEKGAEVLTRL